VKTDWICACPIPLESTAWSSPLQPAPSALGTSASSGGSVRGRRSSPGSPPDFIIFIEILAGPVLGQAIWRVMAGLWRFKIPWSRQGGSPAKGHRSGPLVLPMPVSRSAAGVGMERSSARPWRTWAAPLSTMTANCRKQPTPSATSCWVHSPGRNTDSERENRIGLDGCRDGHQGTLSYAFGNISAPPEDDEAGRNRLVNSAVWLILRFSTGNWGGDRHRVSKKLAQPNQ